MYTKGWMSICLWFCFFVYFVLSLLVLTRVQTNTTYATASAGGQYIMGGKNYWQVILAQLSHWVLRHIGGSCSIYIYTHTTNKKQWSLSLFLWQNQISLQVPYYTKKISDALYIVDVSIFSNNLTEHMLHTSQIIPCNPHYIHDSYGEIWESGSVFKSSSFYMWMDKWCL